MTEEKDYKILEWKESQFVECCKTIIAGCGHTIQRIELDNGSNVYLVPEAFYLSAKKKRK